MHLVGGDGYIASLIRQLVGNILRVQLIDHRCCVLVGQVGVQQLIIGRLDPQRNGEQSSNDQGHAPENMELEEIRL